MIHRTLYKIQEFPSNIKHRYQRAKKGYSYQDVWSIDNWFVKIMPQMLTDLKNEVRGCPMSFTYKNGVEYQSVEQGTEEWKSVLDRMAFCFKEVNEDTCSIKNEFNDDEPELEEKYHNRQREINDYREKMKKEGLELFSKHFSDLWD